jgi:hypothetical protein
MDAHLVAALQIMGIRSLFWLKALAMSCGSDSIRALSRRNNPQLSSRRKPFLIWCLHVERPA